MYSSSKNFANNGQYTMNYINSFTNKQSAYIVVLSKNCGHCTTLRSDFEKLGLFKNTNKVLFIYEHLLPKEFTGVEYYPQIFEYSNGRRTQRRISKEQLMNYIK